MNSLKFFFAVFIFYTQIVRGDNFEPRDTHNFFSVFQNTLTLNGDFDSKTKLDLSTMKERIRKVPLSNLKNQFKEGDKISWVDIKNGGKIKTFVFKKEIFILLLSKHSDEASRKSSYSIVLSYEDDEIKNLDRYLIKNSHAWKTWPLVEGFAYVGKERNLSGDSGLHELIFRKDKAKNVVPKSSLSMFTEDVQVSRLLNRIFILASEKDSEVPTQNLFLIVDNNLISVSQGDPVSSKIKYGKWFGDDSISFLTTNESEGEPCIATLNIVTSQKLERVNFCNF